MEDDAEQKDLIKEESNLIEKLNKNISQLGAHLEKVRIDEYTSMLTRPWRFMWFNFLAGVFRGLGIAIGFTVIFGLIAYFLSNFLRQFVDMPVIGYYVAQLVELVNTYLKEGTRIR